MSRDLGKEIDELRAEIGELRRAASGRAPKKKGDLNSLMRFYSKSSKDIGEMSEELRKAGKRAPEWGMELAQEAMDRSYQDGIAKFGGIFRSPADEGHMWNLEYPIEELLQLDESVVEKILSAIGNRARLKILKAILKSPSNAVELVAALNLNTTGKAYHHLNLLENADLIHKDEAGRYHFRGHRVSGFFAALFSVKNTMSDKYTSGHIDELPLGAED